MWKLNLNDTFELQITDSKNTPAVKPTILVPRMASVFLACHKKIFQAEIEERKNTIQKKKKNLKKEYAYLFFYTILYHPNFFLICLLVR